MYASTGLFVAWIGCPEVRNTESPNLSPRKSEQSCEKNNPDQWEWPLRAWLITLPSRSFVFDFSVCTGNSLSVFQIPITVIPGASEIGANCQHLSGKNSTETLDHREGSTQDTKHLSLNPTRIRLQLFWPNHSMSNWCSPRTCAISSHLQTCFWFWFIFRSRTHHSSVPGISWGLFLQSGMLLLTMGP